MRHGLCGLAELHTSGKSAKTVLCKAATLVTPQESSIRAGQISGPHWISPMTRRERPRYLPHPIHIVLGVQKDVDVSGVSSRPRYLPLRMISITSCLSSIFLATLVSSAPASSSLLSAASTGTHSSSITSAVVSVATSVSAISSAVVSVGSSRPLSSSSPVIPVGSSTISAPEPSATVPFASDDPNLPEWGIGANVNPQPERGQLGAPLLGPTNEQVAQQNPDMLAPPTTDAGSVQNAKWPFSLSHNRLQTGGWARQQNSGVMPIATAMAGVNMRLEPGAIRELHWHKTAEWAYVLKGSTQITSVDAQGRNYLATVNAGDLWYFPPGVPHSLQGTSDDPEGSEFLLVFPDGAFSEDSTFLLTDWLAHVPAEVIAKNFQANISAFDHIPAKELYIFPSSPPPDDATDVQSPQGTVPDPFSFALSKAKATQLSGGSVKVVDSSTFKISTDIAAAEVTVEPGAMRELHWHPTQDEWSFFIEGEARVTLFASSGHAQTFNYQPGDIGYVPASFGHYVENLGNTTLKYLEIFNSAKFEDISLNQWLALTPPALVKAHLGLSDDTIAHLSKTKPTVIGPA